MKSRLIDILKGKFLVSEDAVKNWRFILFASALAVLMIASSHSVDKKVHQIARLNDEVKELKSEYVDTRATMQQMKLESAIMARLKDRGVKQSETPPRKIVIAGRN
ncbi:FtsL-like putative cell division protein [Sinomicrobium soli]|uniref:FtsL-like putative cell division protein n=1 Tax=Sinomicrobium sp. N-1-3-6 TaxID=2219864 RepID=UPI000DCBAB60|nr:FtsL-like putative cell division protein [Sinomicrobium sp. N-1-3-6]RAV30696.1 S-adenosyl-methyltransferase [Sinomicrobium sp. N-1-3-6]